MKTAATSKPEPKGGIRWTAEMLADDGIDPAALDSIYSTMAHEPHNDLKGIVIIRGGHLVSEHYFSGDSADTPFTTSGPATKSLTSLLMEIVIQRRLVQSVADSISLYIPGTTERWQREDYSQGPTDHAFRARRG
jgi:hypothetical protein